LHVSVSKDNVALRCATDVLDGFEPVRVFVSPAGNSEFTDRFLNTANAALIGGRPLVLTYEARPWTQAAPAPGCPIKECRVAITISIR
jgi:hypothetical protein